jgi:imidazolonepropionase
MNGLLTNIGTLATCPWAGGPGDLGLIHDAALAWEAGRITWAGREADLPGSFHGGPIVDAGGALVVPGLIDCHTHLAFAGWRADEFERRCRGTTYAEIAETGGGIAETVRRTRAATGDELLARARGFLEEMTELGVTTVEAKSGYGLTVDDEMKFLRVYGKLRAEGPRLVIPTLLGAHAVPPEYREDRSGYLDLVCWEMIPRAAKERAAAFCDVFVEGVAFTPDEARRVFVAARAHGLVPKLHADQLGDNGGAALAAEVGAVSADHLDFASDEGLAAMAARGVVGVLLPLAALYLRLPPVDVRRWLRAGVRVAVATDFNPGTAPSYHLPLALSLACAQHGLTPAEALRGATTHAARAVGLHDRVGSLEPTKRADFILIDAESVEHWLYHFRPNAVTGVFVAGERVR